MGKCIVAVVLVSLAAAGSAWGAAHAVVLKVGQTQRFAAAMLRPGQSVRCVNDGHVLSVDAPASTAVSNGTAWTQPGTTHFHLHVTAKAGGGYRADCGLGGFHWKTPVVGTRHQRSPRSYLAI